MYILIALVNKNEIWQNEMTRIEQEKRTVRKMIELYCRHHLHQDTMPDEYQHLADFACRRLDHCTYGEQKTACKDCPTHCYAPKEREAAYPSISFPSPRCCYQQVLQQRESYGLYYSDWLRPVNMEVLQFLVLRATSG